LLTKILQCDVDGDEMLLTPDKAFIDLLDRNKLPLYYEMKKAEPSEVNKRNIFECLMRSFKNEKIGDISNVMTKYMNMAYEVDTDFIRVMTAYNNFCIDNPKSQYMPSIGKYQEIYNEWLERECPYFFKYAKDKRSDKCCDNEKVNKRSNINRISKCIEKSTKSNKDNIWIHSIDGSNFNPRYFQDVDFKIERSSDTYKTLRDSLIKLKKIDTEKFRERLRKKYNSSKNDKKSGYDIYYFYCNSVLLNIVKETYNINERIGFRRKTALYLLDIEYFQEENIDSDKSILWNCFGDILYENLTFNLKHKPEELFKVKRNVYKKFNKREEEIQEMIESVQNEMTDEYKIPIMDFEYSWISNLSCRKGCENDRYLLYLLLVLHKRKQKYLSKMQNQKNITDDNRNHFRIYNNARYRRVTRNTIDRWLGRTIAKKGMERLIKRELIRVIYCNKYDKIYLNLPEPTANKREIFFVTDNNPMIDFYVYSGEAKVKECVICHKRFLVTSGNIKTCSPKCSRINELRNKNM